MSINLAEAKMALDVASDLVSAPRNAITAATKGAAPVLPFLVVAQGILAILTGSYTAVTSGRNMRQSIKNHDRQGTIIHGLGTLAGVAQTTLGCAATTCGASTLQNHAVAAAGAGDAILPSLMSVYGLFLAKSVYTIVQIEKLEASLSLDDDQLFKFVNNNSFAKNILGEGRFKDMNAVRQKIRENCLDVKKDKVTQYAISAICLLGIVATYASWFFADTCPELASILYTIGATLWIFIDYKPLHDKLREMVANRLL